MSRLGRTLAGLSFLPLAVVSGQSPVDIESISTGLKFREVGPAVMGGRIADLAVVESKPQVFYVGTASGGLWKTENHGTTWQPLFDDQPTASIGDVTLAPSNPNVVWVGSGEPQNRQSSPWGDGVYKSTDGGRTWKHLGLNETRHIGRIVVHPRDPAVAYVAAVGHLWGPNPERGVYKTSDGGASWELVLFVDENTGAIDLAMDPGDPQTLLAAMYQRRRTGYGFNGGGPGSGIYRTTDGGTSWTELTSGLPAGDKGRIGLDFYRGDGNLIYAVVEADARDPTRRFGDPPSAPRERMSGVYRSTDRGETWEKASDTNPRPMYYSQIRVDPSDPERIYVLGTQLMISEDGGKTFRSDGAETIHVDHHALWIDPNDSEHLIIGNDGGVAASFDRAASWRMYDNLAIGQFYQVGVDMRDPYYVCGGLQDNSSWCAPNQTLSIYGVRNGDWYDVWGGDGFFNVIDHTDHTIMYSESQGGNVGRVDVTTGERKRIRPNARPNEGVEGEEDRQYRWNWNAPIVISVHDPATIYIGSNHLMRSRDRGHSWQEASPDLTKQVDRTSLEIMGVIGSEPMISANDGISTYGNITAVGESPLDPQLIYVGTDDGNVQVTRDGGTTWKDVTSNVRGLPERTYVSRVVSSRFVEGRLYATFDGHRNDDYRPYVYVSEDYGEDWDQITTGLPDGWSVNVIAEHHSNANMLFVGTEIGLYLSIDRGGSWARLKANLPTVPIDDIVIHPRDNDLILGTHGRSIWILHDIGPLEEIGPELLTQPAPAHLFHVRDVTMRSLSGGWPFHGANYSAPNPPSGATIRYYLGEEVVGDSAQVALEIISGSGTVVRELKAAPESGLHEVTWDLRAAPPFEDQQAGQGGFSQASRGPLLMPGSYAARLTIADEILTSDFVVAGDPRISVAQTELQARQAALESLNTLNKALREATQTVTRLDRHVSDIETLLEDAEGVPDSLVSAAEDLGIDIDSLRQDLRQAERDARISGSIEGSTSAPTADQAFQIDRVWEKATGLILGINEIVETRLPALYEALDRHGVRPAVGDPVAVPHKP